MTIHQGEESSPSVRILRGLARGAEGRGSLMLGILIALALGAWLLDGLYSVENGRTAVVKRFGRVVPGTVESGLQFRLPYPIETEEVFSSGEVFRLEVSEANGARIEIISGDENLIATSLVVQYMVTDPARFLYGIDSPNDVISLVAQTALLETMAKMEVDEILTTGKGQIQNRIRDTTQQKLREYNLGVSILATTLQSVDPPTEAAIAFRAVQDARTEASRTLSDSEMLREHVMSLTRAEAAKMLEEASVGSRSRVLEAQGAADRFGALSAQYDRAPEQTRLELYQTVISKVVTRAETIVLAPGESPTIDVNMGRR